MVLSVNRLTMFADSSTDVSADAPVPSQGIVPNPLIDDFSSKSVGMGVLIPLKTTQEVRQDHTIVHAYITRSPTKCANDVISLVFVPRMSQTTPI